MVRPNGNDSYTYTVTANEGHGHSNIMDWTFSLEAQPSVGYLFKGWYEGYYNKTSGNNYEMRPAYADDTTSPPTLSRPLSEELNFSGTIGEDDVYVCAVFELCVDHSYVTQITRAKPEADGRLVTQCSKCRFTHETQTIAGPKEYKLSSSSFTCDGKTKTPSVTVTDSAGKTIPAGHYSVSYLNNITPGTATARVTFTGDYYDGIKDIPFTIKQAADTVTFQQGTDTAAVQQGTDAVAVQKIPGTMKARGKTVKIKAEKLKNKKQTIKAARAMSVSGASGRVTYKKVRGNQKIRVASNGKITVKKGLKAGIYKIRIRVRDAGTATVAAKEKVVTVRIKVK